MVVHCLRTSFGKLNLEDFKKVARADILIAPVVLMGGGKFAPAPRPSEDVEELYGCAQRVARFLSLMFHREVGAVTGGRERRRVSTGPGGPPRWYGQPLYSAPTFRSASIGLAAAGDGSSLVLLTVTNRFHIVSPRHR